MICLQRDLVPILAGFISVFEIGRDLKPVFVGKFVPADLEFSASDWEVRISNGSFFNDLTITEAAALASGESFLSIMVLGEI